MECNKGQVNTAHLTCLKSNYDLDTKEITNPFLTQPEHCPDAFLTYDAGPNIICSGPTQVPKFDFDFPHLWH